VTWKLTEGPIFSILELIGSLEQFVTLDSDHMSENAIFVVREMSKLV
jgi:hypothetical protein